jgi:hypothetical protein
MEFIDATKLTNDQLDDHVVRLRRFLAESTCPVSIESLGVSLLNALEEQDRRDDLADPGFRAREAAADAQLYDAVFGPQDGQLASWHAILLLVAALALMFAGHALHDAGAVLQALGG